MMDHLLSFENEAAAQAALPQFGTLDEDDVWHWDGARVIAPISIITADAVWDMSDAENPVLQYPEECLPGFWLAIATDELMPTLRDLPDNACRFIASRVLASQSEPFLIYTAPDINMGLLATTRVAPVFAGSQYTFG